jgi:hypothetical protein
MGSYKKRIEIPKDRLEKWKLFKSDGDVGILSARADVSGQTIYNAFKDGWCQRYVYDVMTAFYAEKMEKFLNDLDGLDNE